MSVSLHGWSEKVRIEELRYLVEEAARDLSSKRGRPVPTAVVLPGMPNSRVIELPDFPADDETRHAVLSALAADRMADTPAFGFIAEAEAEGEDILIAVYGATNHPTQISAAWFRDDGAIGEFSEPEPLDPRALPFLHPLRSAVDAVH